MSIGPSDSASNRSAVAGGFVDVTGLATAVPCIDGGEFVVVFKECGAELAVKWLGLKERQMDLVARCVDLQCASFRASSSSQGSAVSDGSSSARSSGRGSVGARSRLSASTSGFPLASRLSRRVPDGLCYTKTLRRSVVDRVVADVGEWPSVRSLLLRPAVEYQGLAELHRFRVVPSGAGLAHVAAGGATGVSFVGLLSSLSASAPSGFVSGSLGAVVAASPALRGGCAGMSLDTLLGGFVPPERRLVLAVGSCDAIPMPDGCVVVCMTDSEKRFLERRFSSRVASHSVCTYAEASCRLPEHVWVCQVDPMEWTDQRAVEGVCSLGSVTSVVEMEGLPLEVSTVDAVVRQLVAHCTPVEMVAFGSRFVGPLESLPSHPYVFLAGSCEKGREPGWRLGAVDALPSVTLVSPRPLQLGRGWVDSLDSYPAPGRFQWEEMAMRGAAFVLFHFLSGASSEISLAELASFPAGSNVVVSCPGDYGKIDYVKHLCVERGFDLFSHFGDACSSVAVGFSRFLDDCDSNRCASGLGF